GFEFWVAHLQYSAGLSAGRRSDRDGLALVLDRSSSRFDGGKSFGTRWRRHLSARRLVFGFEDRRRFQQYDSDPDLAIPLIPVRRRFSSGPHIARHSARSSTPRFRLPGLWGLAAQGQLLALRQLPNSFRYL